MLDKVDYWIELCDDETEGFLCWIKKKLEK